MTKTLDTRINALQARQKEIVAEIGVLAEQDESEDVTEKIEALNADFDKNDSDLEILGKARERANTELTKRVVNAIPIDARPGQQPPNQELDAWDALTVPAKAKTAKSRVFDSDRECYFAGLSIFAMCGSSWAKNKLSDIGFKLQIDRSARNDMEGGTPTLGGYTVPVPLAATIIRLVEEYGVLRQNARVMPMTAATLDVPKRSAGLTVRYPGEGEEIVRSDLTFAQINLVAKKVAHLAVWSTELNEDSVISMTDLLVQEMAWSFAKDEDTNGFLGDGTSGSNSITGVKSALQAGAQVTGGANWGALTLDTYHQAVAKLQMYPGMEIKWYINHQGWAESMQALAYAAGGNTVMSVSGGMQEAFMGYPVVKSQALPRVVAAGELLAVCGDLRLGMMLGSRRDVTMQILRERYAEYDQIGLVSTMRHDIVVHEVGDATEAGCIVGIYGTA